MKIKYFCLLALLTMTFSACKKTEKTEEDNYSELRKTMEKDAAVCMKTARQQFAAGNFEQARETIIKMREDFPQAITARKQAILLMDSVELEEARKELAETDSLLRTQGTGNADMLDEACKKVEFYGRKLKHDIEQYRSGK
ncbi:MAG: hypothetical protein ACI3YC_00220 [Alloprevotella sp.]